MAVSNLSVIKKKKGRGGWSGSLAFPFFTIIIGFKIIGVFGSLMLMVILLYFHMSETSLVIHIPELMLDAGRAYSPNPVPTSPFASASELEVTKKSVHFTDATETPIVTMLAPPGELITRTPFYSKTPENTQPIPITITQFGKLTTTPFPSATTAFTPTITPFVSTFNGMMNTPLTGIPFEDLELIISQPFIQGIEPRDIGHYAVDFGSYDYKGKNINNWPIQAVFSGKVSSVVDNRTPVGNALIIESSFNNLPEKMAKLIGLKPDQSLYQLYGHMIDQPGFKIGEDVKSGDVIGHVGKSRTVEAHLHYETRIGPPGVVFEGFAYYSGDITPEEKSNYERFRMSGEFKSFDPMIVFYNAMR